MLKHILIGAMMLVGGVLLRIVGGETDIGPFELRTVGNVIAIMGGVEIIIAAFAGRLPVKKTD